MALSVGVIGATGRVARSRHIQGALAPLRADGRIDRILLGGRDAGALLPVAESLGLEASDCADVSTVMRDPSIDVVLVASPPSSHAELSEAVLAAGKHLVVEKPVDPDPEVVRRLCAQAREASLSATMVMDKAYAPGFIALKRQLGQQPEEAVLAISGDFGYFVDSGLDPVRPSQRPSWNYRAGLGGSLSADIFSHWSYMLELVGRPARVQALGSTRVTTRRDESGSVFPVDVPDWLHVAGELHTGVPFGIEVSWVRRPASPFRMRVDTEGASFCAEVSGLTIFEGSGPSPDEGRADILPPVVDEFLGQWEAFIAAVEAKAADVDGLMAGARAAAFVRAIDASASTGRVAAVQEVA